MRTDLAAALLRYRVMAWITGVMIIILFFVAVPLSVTGHRQLSQVLGPIHGLLYIVYLGVAYDLSRRCQWSVGKTVLVLLSGTIPFLTFFVEHQRTREVRALIAAKAVPA